MAFILRYLLLVLLVSLFAIVAKTQAVPVRNEPLHKPVFTNKYLRLLNVWLKPGDTSLYHIHEIPSVFCYLTSARYVAKMQGDSNWNVVVATAGQSWYRSFEDGRLVHKVANPFDTALHVTDIELLSAWKRRKLSPLPLPLLFPSDKVYAYQVNNGHLSSLNINNRGPMIAEVVNGNIVYQDIKANKSRELKEGDYQYIQPGKHFKFVSSSTDTVNIVLFEIR